jgi:hypothetical protein
VALEQSDGWGAQVAVNLAGLGALVAISLVAAWYRERERGTPAAGRSAGLPDAVVSPRTRS